MSYNVETRVDGMTVCSCRQAWWRVGWLSTERAEVSNDAIVRGLVLHTLKVWPHWVWWYKVDPAKSSVQVYITWRLVTHGNLCDLHSVAMAFGC